jgi:thiamine biosynthesis lipoprotein
LFYRSNPSFYKSSSIPGVQAPAPAEKAGGEVFTRIFLASIFLCIAINISAQQKRFSFTEPKMGSPFAITFYSDDSIRATFLAKRCFELVDSFVLIFSDYIDTSELSKLSASAGINARPVAVSPALLDILVLSKIAFDKSGGAFDITIGPLVKLWRSARKTKQFPANEAIQPARSSIGFNNMIIDTVNKKVTLSKPGMQLDLGGIAQGWIAQKIIDFLHTQQVDHALVNASGDIVMSSAPPGSAGWMIGVNVPETTDEILPQTLLMQNKAVTTSGDAYQFIENAGKRYSHIIDPRTGYGVTSQRNVTVIAGDGTMADWLATACSILPIKKAKKLAAQMGAEVLIAQIKSGKLIFDSTKGFAVYWKQRKQ